MKKILFLTLILILQSSAFAQQSTTSVKAIEDIAHDAQGDLLSVQAKLVQTQSGLKTSTDPSETIELKTEVIFLTDQVNDLTKELNGPVKSMLKFKDELVLKTQEAEKERAQANKSKDIVEGQIASMSEMDAKLVRIDMMHSLIAYEQADENRLEKVRQHVEAKLDQKNVAPNPNSASAVSDHSETKIGTALVVTGPPNKVSIEEYGTTPAVDPQH